MTTKYRDALDKEVLKALQPIGNRKPKLNDAHRVVNAMLNYIIDNGPSDGMIAAAKDAGGLFASLEAILLAIKKDEEGTTTPTGTSRGAATSVGEASFVGEMKNGS